MCNKSVVYISWILIAILLMFGINYIILSLYKDEEKIQGYVKACVVFINMLLIINLVS